MNVMSSGLFATSASGTSIVFSLESRNEVGSRFSTLVAAGIILDLIFVASSMAAVTSMGRASSRAEMISGIWWVVSWFLEWLLACRNRLTFSRWVQ